MFLVQLVAQLAAVRKHLSRDMRFLDHGSVQEHSAYSRNKELPHTGALLVLNNNKKPASPFLVTSAIVTRKKKYILQYISPEATKKYTSLLSLLC